MWRHLVDETTTEKKTRDWFEMHGFILNSGEKDGWFQVWTVHHRDLKDWRRNRYLIQKVIFASKSLQWFQAELTYHLVCRWIRWTLRSVFVKAPTWRMHCMGRYNSAFCSHHLQAIIEAKKQCWGVRFTFLTKTLTEVGALTSRPWDKREKKKNTLSNFSTGENIKCTRVLARSVYPAWIRNASLILSLPLLLWGGFQSAFCFIISGWEFKKFCG